MRKLCLTFLVATLFSSCATSPQPEPENFVIDNGKSGLLIEIFISDADSFGVGVFQQHLILMKYDPTTTDEATGPKAKLTLSEKKMKVASYRDNYLFQNLEPGHYMLRGLVQQDFWQTCFQDKTIKFEVKPNTIAYLGRWDVSKNASQLQKKAINAGHKSTSGSARYFYFDDIIAPQITPPTEYAMTRAKSSIAKFSPDSKTPIVKTEFTPAKFRTGKNLLGQRTC